MSIRIAPYWARVKVDRWEGVGWSFHTPEEAEQNARARAQRNADRAREGGFGDPGAQYYPDRPLREPILREMRDSRGEVSALVSKGRYGALMLSTAGALFVDVDFQPEAPQKAPGFIDSLKALLGRKSPAPPAASDPLQPILEKAIAWERAHPGWQWRVYRTRAGARLLATHAPIAPGEPIVTTVFDAFGADPLYRKLCANQQCYRARLTPKPWRCDYHAPGQYWPFPSPAAEAEYNKWESGYLEKCREWSTCELVRDGNGPGIHPDLQAIVEFHDATTRVGSGLPLA